MVRKDQIRQIIQIIIITSIVYFLTNLNYFRYPIFASRYVTSASIFEYLKNNGHLPLSKLEYFDNYQSIIFISYLLDYFVSIIQNTHLFIGILFFYSFPIIIYLLTFEIGDYFLKKEDLLKKKWISIFNMIVASFSSYILILYNETLTFIFIFLLLFVYFKDGLKFGKKFYIIAFSATIILTFYYYTGFLIYVIFFFFLYLFHLIKIPENNKKSRLFLFLSCLNFWIFFILYGIAANVGFAISLQNMISQFLPIPSTYVFLYASVIILYIHILLAKYFKKISRVFITFIRKTIKIWNFFLIFVVGFLLIYVLINFDKFFKPQSQNLLNFNFPASYFDPISRILNLSNLLFLLIPFIFYGIRIMQKLNQGVSLNEIDIFYIIFCILVLIFIPIFYIYGGLNMVFIRCTKMITPFALLFSGFFYINNTKKFLFFQKKSKNNDIETKVLKVNKINSNYLDHKFIDLNKDGRKKNDKLVYILILQTVSQYLLVIFLHDIYSLSFLVFFLKFVLINLNYFILPGYLSILLFTNNNFPFFEKYVWALFISFLLVVSSLTILNFLYLFNLNFLLVLPFTFNILFFILWFLNKRKRFKLLVSNFLKIYLNKFNKKP